MRDFPAMARKSGSQQTKSLVFQEAHTLTSKPDRGDGGTEDPWLSPHVDFRTGSLQATRVLEERLQCGVRRLPALVPGPRQGLRRVLGFCFVKAGEVGVGE